MFYEQSNLFYDFMRMNLFSQVRQTNLVHTVFLFFIMYLWKNETFMAQIMQMFHWNNLPAFLGTYFHMWKRRALVLEGKRCEIMYSYNQTAMVTHTFSEKFQAIWKYMEDHLSEFQDIYQLQEFHSIRPNLDNGGSSIIINAKQPPTPIASKEMFIISQPTTFLLDPIRKIYGRVLMTKNVNKNDKNEGREVDTIRITLYSYVTSMVDLREWLDDIHMKYRSAVAGARAGKQYVYTLFPPSSSTSSPPMSISYSSGGGGNSANNAHLSNWKETIFDTTRQFSNIFFEGKDAILHKIDFFLNNRAWYYEYGIPYTLGIGMYGKPGTGKTSFIKCLAKYTGRHVILLTFKHIRTKKQLEEYFYESQYHVGNEPNSIGFDQKIIVMEDLDCIGDIVLDRSLKNNVSMSTSADALRPNKVGSPASSPTVPCTTVLRTSAFGSSTESVSHDDSISSEMEILKDKLTKNEQKIKDIADPENKKKEEDNDRLTLDDILNLMDGIRETPGRILVITSNHYDRLDPALVRPGRIDMKLPMTYASHETIRQIYLHFFKVPIDESVFEHENLSEEFKYSPAELVNFYVNSHGNADAFMAQLLS